MRVDEIMTRAVVTVTPATGLKEAAEIMSRHHVSGVPVVEHGDVVGVVSESDVVRRESGLGDEEDRRGLLARLRRRARSVDTTTVAGAMTGPPIVVEPWMPASAAAWEMTEHDVNRLPVVKRGRLVGIVSRADLVRAFARSDADVRREIVEHVLPSLGLAPVDLSVEVSHGEVTLRGELDSEMEAECLPRAVRYVTGVVAVRPELTVRVRAGGSAAAGA
jgi:CBS domain-containing protein